MKIKNPLLSLDATGTIGNIISFQHRWGKSVAVKNIADRHKLNTSLKENTKIWIELSKCWKILIKEHKEKWTTENQKLLTSHFARFYEYNYRNYKTKQKFYYDYDIIELLTLQEYIEKFIITEEQEQIFSDNFNDNILNTNKWQYHPFSDFNPIEQNQQLEFVAEQKIIGILQGKVNNNTLFINPQKNFSLKYETKMLTDNNISIVMFGFGKGPEPLFLQTKTINGTRQLFGAENPILNYNNEKITCELIYQADTKKYIKRFKIELDADWRLEQIMDWEGTDTLELLIISISLTEEGGFPGPPINHNIIYDDIELKYFKA